MGKAEMPVTSAGLTPAQEALGYRLTPVTLSDTGNRPVFWLNPVHKTAELVDSIIEQGWPVAELRDAIQNMGGHPVGRSRADLARMYVDRLLDPERLEQAVAQLLPEERAFFSLMLMWNYSRPLKGAQTGENLPFKAPDGDARRIHNRLGELGLGVVSHGGERFVLLDEIVRRLPPLSVGENQPGRELSPAILGDPHTLVLQTQQLLQLIQSEPLTPKLAMVWQPGPNHPLSFLVGITPTEESLRSYTSFGAKNAPSQGRIEVMPPAPLLETATLQRWEEVLGLTPERSEFLFNLLLVARILTLGNPVRVDRELAARFLALPPENQAWALFQSYRFMGHWDGFWPAWRVGKMQALWTYRKYWNTGTTFNSTMGQLQYALRQNVLGILAFLPADVWLSATKVLEGLADFFPSPESLPLHEVLTLTTQDGWPGFLKFYLENLLRGPLNLLGVVDVTPLEAGPLAFRLHHLQDLILERQFHMPMPEIVWQGELAVKFFVEEEALLLMPPVPSGVLYQVQRWSDPAGVLGKALRYHFNARRLHATFEAGETPETLARHWAAAAGFDAPPDLKQWWRYWWDRYGHLRLYPGQTVLLLRDEFALQELQAALPEFRQALLGTVTPRAALLDRSQTPTLIKLLQARGYMPKEED